MKSETGNSRVAPNRKDAVSQRVKTACSLTVGMIVKDEGVYLRDCLTALRTLVD